MFFVQFKFDLSDLEMDLMTLMIDVLDLEVFHRNLFDNVTGAFYLATACYLMFRVYLLIIKTYYVSRF